MKTWTDTHFEKPELLALILTAMVSLFSQTAFSYDTLDGSIGLMDQAIKEKFPASNSKAKWAGSCSSCHQDGISPTKAMAPFGALLAQPNPKPVFGGIAPVALNAEIRQRLTYAIGNDPMSGQPFDSDGDGATNAQEVEAGSDPGSALSKPGIGGPVGPTLGRDQYGLSVGSAASSSSVGSTAGCGDRKSSATADMSHLILFGLPVLITQGLKRRRKK